MKSDRAWVDAVTSLTRHGLSEPGLLVFILSHYDVVLPTGRSDRFGGAERALAAVAAALGKPRGEVQAAYTARISGRSEAAKVVAEAEAALPVVRAALPDARVEFDAPTFLVYYGAKHGTGSRPPPRDRAAMGPARARVISRVLNLTSVLVAIWVFRRPTQLVALAAAFGSPLLALAVASLGRGAFQLLRDKADERPTLWIALFVPAALASVLVFVYDLVAPVELLPPALGIGVVLTALAAAGDRAVRARWQWLALLPLMVGFSAAALTHANCLEDASPATEYEATVLDKWMAAGRRGRTPSLELGPWGPRPGPSTVHVRREVYESARRGEAVRIQLRPGRLGFAWFRVLPARPAALRQDR